MNIQFEQLLGRPYVIGIDHCLKLVRDFYTLNYGINIADYPLPVDWDADKTNLIEMVHEREGFTKLSDWTIATLRPGDLLCVAVRSANPNHFVINLGGNQMLHHPFMQMSRVETLRDFWRMSTCFVLRHPDVPYEPIQYPDTTIEELMRERNRTQAEA